MYLAVAPVKFKADVRVEDEASQGDVSVCESRCGCCNADDAIYDEKSLAVSFDFTDMLCHLLPHHVRAQMQHGDVCVQENEGTEGEKHLSVRI